jgi:hypothetical protein
MKGITAILGGIGLGAALMYLYDPKDGRRRRAMIRDKANSIGNDAKRAIDKRSRDVKNRAQGLLHEAKSKFSSGDSIQNQPSENKTF